jgi:hypothetical protein
MALPLNLHPAGRLHLNFHHNSQGYFIQQLQWSITNFIGKPVITSYSVCLAYNYFLAVLLPLFFATFFLDFLTTCYLIGACKIINYLVPLMSCRVSPSVICMSTCACPTQKKKLFHVSLMLAHHQNIKKTEHCQLFGQLLIQ